MPAHTRITAALALGAAATLAFTAPAYAEEESALRTGNDVTLDASVGDGVDMPFELYNTGPDTTGVKLRAHATGEAVPYPRFANCRYALLEHVTVVECLFDGTVAAGHAYGLAQSFTVTTGDRYYGTSVDHSWFAPGDEGYDLPDSVPWEQGAGGVLGLTDLGPGTPPTSNDGAEITIRLRDHSGWDLAAVGSTVTGTAGQTVRAAVGVENKAATLDAHHSDESLASARFTVPKGTTVVAVPDGCTTLAYDEDGGWTSPGKPRYNCALGHYLPAGAKTVWTFGLRLDKDVEDAEGAVAVVMTGDLSEDRAIEADKDHGNDRAKVVVNPSPPKPGATTTPAGRPAVGQGLAKTGPPVLLIGGTAAGLTLFGAVLLAAVRRRRA